MIYEIVQLILIGLWPETISLHLKVSKSGKPSWPITYLCDSQEPEKKSKVSFITSVILRQSFFHLNLAGIVFVFLKKNESSMWYKNVFCHVTGDKQNIKWKYNNVSIHGHPLFTVWDFCSVKGKITESSFLDT